MHKTYTWESFPYVTDDNGNVSLDALLGSVKKMSGNINFKGFTNEFRASLNNLETFAYTKRVKSTRGVAEINGTSVAMFEYSTNETPYREKALLQLTGSEKEIKEIARKYSLPLTKARVTS